MSTGSNPVGLVLWNSGRVLATSYTSYAKPDRNCIAIDRPGLQCWVTRSVCQHAERKWREFICICRGLVLSSQRRIYAENIGCRRTKKGWLVRFVRVWPWSMGVLVPEKKEQWPWCIYTGRSRKKTNMIGAGNVILLGRNVEQWLQSQSTFTSLFS